MSVKSRKPYQEVSRFWCRAALIRVRLVLGSEGKPAMFFYLVQGAFLA